MKNLSAKNQISVWSVILSAALLFASSGQASETVKGLHKDAKAAKEEMQKSLDKIDLKIQELRQEAKTKSSETSDRVIQDLEAGRDKLKADLQAMKEEGGDKWDKFKSDFAAGLDSLNAKAQKALGSKKK